MGHGFLADTGATHQPVVSSEVTRFQKVLNHAKCNWQLVVSWDELVLLVHLICFGDRLTECFPDLQNHGQNVLRGSPSAIDS